MRTFIAPIGHGLGDLVVSLPAVQALIAAGDETVLVQRSQRQAGMAELIAGLRGCIMEENLPNKLAPGQRYINLREHPLQTEHVWGSAAFEAKYPGYKITDILTDICRDFGIPIDYEKLVPLPFSPEPRAQDKVVFLPGSDGTFKCWPTANWLALRDALAKRGYESVMIGQPERSEAVANLLKAGMDWLATPTLKAALNAVSTCRAIASVDTGLMHLALHQGTPVAAMWISNPGSMNYLRKSTRCFPVVAPSCDNKCVDEELGKNLNRITSFVGWQHDSWRCHAQPGLSCMERIDQQKFLQAVISAIGTSDNDYSNQKPAVARHHWRT